MFLFGHGQIFLLSCLEKSLLIPLLSEQFQLLDYELFHYDKKDMTLEFVVHIHNNETIEDVKTFLQGPYGTSADLTTSDIDLSKGVVFSKTVSADTVFTFINAPSGRAATFNLIITNGGSATITWPASVKWTDAAAPTLTALGVDVWTFMTPNGSTWYGTLAIVNAG